MKLRTLIAEDEPGVRSFLSGLCAGRSDLEIVAQVETGSAAVDAIRANEPQLLLLEDDLPDMTGLDVLREASIDADAYGVLVTEQPERHFADPPSRLVTCMAKPVNRLQFDRIVDAAVARRGARALDRVHGVQLIGERHHRFHFLDSNQVDYLEVDGNYVVIHVGEDRFLTRTTLKHLCSVLPPREFIRIDRSLLVNLRRVDYVERLENGRFSFSMRQGKHQVMSSRERSPAILRLLRSGLL